jgi:hypothetical protein
MNPLKQGLGDQTEFTVRCYVDLKVTVPKEPADGNGLITGLTRSSNAAQVFCLTRFFPQLCHPISADISVEGPLSAYPETTIVDPSWDNMKGRLFDEMIFMGRGDYSARDCALLTNRLDQALSYLSGIQQSLFDLGTEENIRKAEEPIYDIVRDIAMALTGKEIEFKESTVAGN